MTESVRSGDSDSTSSPQRRIRLAPIVGGAVFVVAAVVLARAATRLARGSCALGSRVLGSWVLRSSAGEGELLDEAVVEVGTVGEFDIVHLLQQRISSGAFARAQ